MTEKPGRLIAKIIELPTEAHIFRGDWGNDPSGHVNLGPQKVVTIPAGHELSRSCPCHPWGNYNTVVAPKTAWEHQDLTRPPHHLLGA